MGMRSELKFGATPMPATRSKITTPASDVVYTKFRSDMIVDMNSKLLLRLRS